MLTSSEIKKWIGLIKLYLFRIYFWNTLDSRTNLTRRKSIFVHLLAIYSSYPFTVVLESMIWLVKQIEVKYHIKRKWIFVRWVFICSLMTEKHALLRASRQAQSWSFWASKQGPIVLYWAAFAKIRQDWRSSDR